jgi:uncharacterized membrane protein HdeD (DUF308 family)
MLEIMARNWWMLAVRGIIAILIGIVALVAPGLALATLVALWGAYALVDGVLSIIVAVRHRSDYSNWWVTLLEGIVGIVAGIATFIWPAITALILLYIIAAWAIITGIFEIIAAIQLRKEITGEFWLGLSGLLSIVFGILLILFPGQGILTLLWLLGIYAIIFGIFLLLLGFRLRGQAGSTSSTSTRKPA